MTHDVNGNHWLRWADRLRSAMVACKGAARARRRTSRELIPWGDPLDERVLLDAGMAGSRAHEMAATAVASAKEKLGFPNLAKFEPMAVDIVKYGFAAPPPKSFDAVMEKGIDKQI
jgi:hypothetical protein